MISIVALFCEDIREEKAGTDSIIGVLPDNMAVPSLPGAMAKLGAYIRIQLPLQNPPNEILGFLKTPWNQTVPLGKVDRALIDLSIKQAKATNLPLAGLLLKGVVGPLNIPMAGLMTIVVVIDGVEQVAAMLNVLAPTSSSA